MRAAPIALALVALISAGCSQRQSSSAKTYEEYPAFNPGGKIDLTFEGTPYTVDVTDVHFANTDEGYDDYVEVDGAGTRLLFTCRKDFDLDFDSETSYQPIVNAALPAGVEGFEDEEMTINLPGLGSFPVTGGSLTLFKYQIGRDGHDWWEGQLSLTLESDQGPKTATGSFAWCTIPVW